MNITEIQKLLDESAQRLGKIHPFTFEVASALHQLSSDNTQVEFAYDGHNFMFEFDNADMTVDLIDENGETIVRYDYEDGGKDFIINDAENQLNYVKNLTI